ncbi:phage terminase small subunit [Brevibacillus borstelensis]|uniref:phage terminase small subunit n=1 Tax=Brevibacillus borstelensis TaxID=45462 RepID=UPI003CE4924E
MPRARDPNRDRAFEIWRDSGGSAKLKDIADELGLSEGTVRGWKNKDKWDEQLNGTLQSNERNAPKKTERSKRPGAPKGNKNAVGNSGGAAPKRNSNAVTHGFFRKFFPDETLEIMEQIETRSPLDMLWDNIVIQYTAIIRAQQIMFVRDQQDETRVLKKQKDGETSFEQEWEYQHAWDKQATFLQAQSRAMATLQSLIRQYEDMCNKGLATEEQRLRVEKLKLEVGKLQSGDDERPTEIAVRRWST